MKFAKAVVFSLFLALLLSGIAYATPSTTYWTPMTPDIQSYGVLHVGIDNYFTVFRTAHDGSGSFPTDVGLTMGVLPFEKIQMEVGVDLLEPSDDPWFFNAKIGAPEGALAQWCPALQIGIFNVGTNEHVTNQDVVYGVIGKTIPGIGGRLSAGPYIGNKDALRDGGGHKQNTGFMVAFDRGFVPVKDQSGNEYNRVVFAADYASGNNAIGGAGFGLYYYFTKDISLLTGPVWFNDEDINGKWKWTTQLDINLSLFGL
ncbi:MAG TPA: hypothetical protein VEI04_09540 [Syntrophobacteria bacterium]|nr:hypothetical protein [Syntrophobacteria bacterium]